MLTDRTFQLVVERLLNIAGEALRQTERSDPTHADRIPYIRDIVGMRNRLIHGYENISYGLLWDIVEGFVPSLEANMNDLLREAQSD